MIDIFLLMVQLSDLSGIKKDPLIVLNSENGQNDILYKPTDLALSDDGHIFILDPGEGHIFKFDLNGNIVGTFSRKGYGPGEICLTTKILTLVENKIWLGDKDSGKIQIFDEKGQFELGFRPKKINRVGSMVVIGNEVFVVDLSLSHSPIEVYSLDHRYLRSIGGNLSINKDYKRTAGLWNFLRMSRGHGDKLVMGFIYDNRIMIWDNNGPQNNYDMQLFYPKHEDVKEGRILPGGYSAVSFSRGPRGSFLIAACDLETRTCGKIIQVTGNMKGLLGQRELGLTIKRIRYNPNLDLLAMINANHEIILYDTY